MVMPFSITFIEVYGDKEHIISCKHFYDEKDRKQSKEEAKLTENSVLKVFFEAPEGSKLYMDGLDQLEENFVLEDAHGFYIRPGKTAYPLYNPAGNRKPYPFIPGSYALQLRMPDEYPLETFVKVVAKRMTEDQHSLMIEEIEDAVKGLSGELTTKRNLYTETALSIFGPEKITTYTMILFNKEKIIHGLQTIDKNRRYSVEKNYPVIPRAKARKIDEKSLKYLTMHPEQQHTIQAPVSTVTYDTPENRWLKAIVQLIAKNVREMKNYCQQPYLKSYNQEQRKQLEKDVQALQNGLMSFLNGRWMQHVQESTTGKVPMALLRVGMYHVFYKLYRAMKQANAKRAPQVGLQFQHKRSDLLYELWGYLKVVERLQMADDFHIVNNHFTGSESDMNYIELTKGYDTVRVFYNEAIPNRKDLITAYKTLFTMSNNTPDCRIDVWKNGKFKGSLMIDFKYRKKEYLWNDERLSVDKPSSVMRQLSAYSTSMKSDSFSLNGARNLLTDAQPVHEVWAVYPMKYEEMYSNYDLNDYLIRLIDLSPGGSFTHFDQLLKQAISEISER